MASQLPHRTAKKSAIPSILSPGCPSPLFTAPRNVLRQRCSPISMLFFSISPISAPASIPTSGPCLTSWKPVPKPTGRFTFSIAPIPCLATLQPPRDRCSMKHLSPHLLEDVQWFPYSKAANPSGGSHFQRLIGQAGIMELIAADPRNAASRINDWTICEPQWRKQAGRYLLYE